MKYPDMAGSSCMFSSVSILLKYYKINNLYSRKFAITFFLSFLSLIILTGNSYAATILVGQSAKWVGSGSRTPSEEIDAVWFNPAGTTELREGLHLSFSHHQLYAHGYIENETVLTDRENFDKLKDKYPMGGYVPYLFYLYLAYRTDDWSYMFSIESPGGLGGGEMPEGTPTEMVGFYLPSVFDPNIVGIRINKMEGKGGGGVGGPALGAAYKINDKFSVSAKARFLVGFNYMEGTYDVTYLYADGSESKYELPAGGNKIKYFGKGYAYGFGCNVNIKPLDDLNIALTIDWFSKLIQKIEFQEGDMTEFDGSPYDGMKYRNQIPTRIGTGIGYNFLPGSRIMLSYDLGLDKYADQEGDENSSQHNDVDASNNNWRGYGGEEYDFQHQINLGVEYQINETFRVSTGAGYLNTAFKPIHQKDFYQWPDRYDLHIGTEIFFSEDTQLEIAYCLYVSLPSHGDMNLFKYDGTHETFGKFYESGSESKYTRYAHIFAWSITTIF